MPTLQTVGFCTLCNGWVRVDGDGEDRTLGDHPDAEDMPCQNAGHEPAALGTIAIADPSSSTNAEHMSLMIQLADPP